MQSIAAEGNLYFILLAASLGLASGAAEVLPAGRARRAAVLCSGAAAGAVVVCVWRGRAGVVFIAAS